MIGQASNSTIQEPGRKALKAEGFEVILVNSNPASIMTDPDMADRTYIEPLTPDVVARVIEQEQPDALLPTMGGQTALNLAVTLAENGTLARFGVELIGADLQAIQKRKTACCSSRPWNASSQGLPVRVRPPGGSRSCGRRYRQLSPHHSSSLHPGGSGGGIAYNPEEYAAICKSGLKPAPSPRS